MLKKRSPPNKVFNPSTVYGFSNICIFKKKKYVSILKIFRKLKTPRFSEIKYSY